INLRAPRLDQAVAGRRRVTRRAAYARPGQTDPSIARCAVEKRTGRPPVRAARILAPARTRLTLVKRRPSPSRACGAGPSLSPLARGEGLCPRSPRLRGEGRGEGPLPAR